MANHALLNNVEHKDLKIITEHSATYGDNRMCSVVFPFEFKHVQADYPIFFHKNPETQEFTSVAMFGFEKDENLFLSEQGWDADYIPLMVQREPFLIGFQESNENGQTVKNTVIHIDLDSPRVSYEKGTEVFLPHGGNSEYLSRISAVLKTIHDAKETTDKFMQKVTELELLEPFNVDVALSDGSNNRLTGYYTINEEKLYKLSGDTLEELNKTGMLMIMYMVVASLENIRGLASRKNAKMKQG